MIDEKPLETSLYIPVAFIDHQAEVGGKLAHWVIMDWISDSAGRVFYFLSVLNRK